MSLFRKLLLPALLVSALAIAYNTQGLFTPGRVSAADNPTTVSGKDDTTCPQPYTTVGRCADKCPNQTDTLLGFDKTTGAAICKAAPTGCPYGDSVPLGPECDRLTPQQAPAATTDQTVPDTQLPAFTGK